MQAVAERVDARNCVVCGKRFFPLWPDEIHCSLYCIDEEEGRHVCDWEYYWADDDVREMMREPEKQ